MVEQRLVLVAGFQFRCSGGSSDNNDSTPGIECSVIDRLPGSSQGPGFHAPGYELILGAVVLSSVVLMAADFHFTGLVPRLFPRHNIWIRVAVLIFQEFVASPPHAGYVIGQEIGFKDMSSLPAGDESPGAAAGPEDWLCKDS